MTWSSEGLKPGSGRRSRHTEAEGDSIAVTDDGEIIGDGEQHGSAHDTEDEDADDFRA